MSRIFHEAFKSAVAKFGIKLTWLSKESGVSYATVTRMTSEMERDIYLEKFGDLFEALPSDSQRFFLEELYGEAIASHVSLEKSIKALDPNNREHRRQAANAMRLIVQKFLIEEGKDPYNLSENTEELAITIKQ